MTIMVQQSASGTSGGSSGAAADSAPPAKRTRFQTAERSDISLTAGTLTAAGQPLTPSLGPHLQVQHDFSDLQARHMVLALQSGLKAEVAWALNALTLLSYRDKDDPKKETTPLSKLPGVLDALLLLVDEWRDIAAPRDTAKSRRLRVLGANRPYRGFGDEDGLVSRPDPLARLTRLADPFVIGPDRPRREEEKQRAVATREEDVEEEWWWDEEGLFNLDEKGRAERQLWAIAASNVIRNMSFLPENESPMVSNRRCMECLAEWLEDQEHEDDELVLNVIETLVNLAPILDLRILQPPTEESARQPNFSVGRLVGALRKCMETRQKQLVIASAEAIGRLVVNPENEALLLPHLPTLYPRLVDMLGLGDCEVQGIAVAVLYNLLEIDNAARSTLLANPWVMKRLVSVLTHPHPLVEVCRKAALILESLAGEVKNREALLLHECQLAELAMAEGRVADVAARILYQLSTDASVDDAPVRATWGSCL